VVTHIPNYSYLDLSALWAVNRQVQVRAAVSNLLDKDPPFLPSLDVSGAAGTFNTFPAYDLTGRRISLSVRASF
jgi:outer membrane receptor protein involved in Fe transport